MRNVLLFSLVVSTGALATSPVAAQSSQGTTQKPPATAPKPAAQTPPPSTQKPPAQTPPPATQKPATQKPAAPRRTTPAPAARSGIAITVTSADRAVVGNVAVDLSGPVNRDGKTDEGGQISFPGLSAGTYRLRFTAENFATFEREVALRAGQIERLDITLNPLPERPAAAAAPPPPPPPAPAIGPRGEPRVLSVVDLVERELVKNDQPRKDTLVACSGNARSMLVQLNEGQTARAYEGAETLYYVIAGEGSIVLDGRSTALQAGTYAALPRGAAHSLTRKGRRPLILLAILSGEPCEEAR